MTKLLPILLMSILLSGELEVDGDLKVTGTIQNDSLAQVILLQQQQINILLNTIAELELRISLLECPNNGIVPTGYCDCFGNVLDVCDICGGDITDEVDCPNYALSFNGDGNYVDCGNDESLNITENITVQAWVYYDGEGSLNPRFIGKRIGDVEQAWSFGLLSGTNLYYEINLVSNPHGKNTGVPLSQNTWHHVALTFSSSSGEIIVYLDGVNVSEVSGYEGDVIKNSSSIVTIGTDFETSDWFSGKIDEATIWDRTLSQEEIQSYMSTTPTGNESDLVGYWKFNEGSGNTLYDHSGNGNHGTINGATWVQINP